MGRRIRHLPYMTRREALGMLGAGAGLALTTGCGGGSMPPPEPAGGAADEAAGAAPDITFPAGAVIRTPSTTISSPAGFVDTTQAVG